MLRVQVKRSLTPPPHRSSQEWERIEEEIRDMEALVEGVANYEVVDKLGEGELGSADGATR